MSLTPSFSITFYSNHYTWRRDEKLKTMDQNISDKVLKYEQFLNDTLKEDLRKIFNQREELYKKTSEYLQVRNIIERIKDDAVLRQKMKVQMDLGCNFYVQTVVPNTSMIYVEVGFGYFVEFTLDEALHFIEKKVKYLESIIEKHTKEVCRIKAHIKMVIEGLRELQFIDNLPDEIPERDIF